MITATLFDTWRAAGPSLLAGLVTSVKLTALSLALGYPLALLLAVVVMSHRRAVRTFALVVIEIGRGAPLLVVLELLYYGLPSVNITLTALVTAVAALALQVGTYGSEIFRASLEAVPVGQHEAADAVGLSRFASFRHVVLPQAIRIAVPPLMNIAIAIFLATSLAFVITVPELMSKAYEYGSKTFEYLNVFILAGILYVAVTLPASAAVAIMERRLNRHL